MKTFSILFHLIIGDTCVAAIMTTELVKANGSFSEQQELLQTVALGPIINLHLHSFLISSCLLVLCLILHQHPQKKPLTHLHYSELGNKDKALFENCNSAVKGPIIPTFIFVSEV